MKRGGLLTTAQQLELSPLAKWRRFGKFPWKMALHMLLVCLITSQAIIVAEDYGGYSRAVGKSWINLFFPEDLTPVDDLHSYEYDLFSTNDTLADGQLLVSTYMTLQAQTMEQVDTYFSAPHLLDRPYVEVTSTGGSLTRYNIDSLATGWPLAEDRTAADVKALCGSMSRLTFHFFVQATAARGACYRWDLQFEYDFSSRGLIEVKCSYNPLRRCERLLFTSDVTLMLGALIGIVAVAYQVLLVKATRHHYRTMKKLINATHHHNETEFRWSHMSLWEKVQVFNLWFIVSTLGNVCAVIYSVWCLVDNVAIVVNDNTKILMGLAIAMYWVALVQYLEFTLRYYVLILTLKRGIPRMFQFLIGILPIFAGYVMFGVVVFGDQSSHFGDISSTAITLFAVVNGDVVRDTFEEIDFLPFASEAYLYSYVFLFMYVVLMACIAIMEEAFFSSASHVLDADAGNMGADGPDGEMEIARRTLPPRLRALVAAITQEEEEEREAEMALEHGHDETKQAQSWFDQAATALRARLSLLGQRSPAPAANRLLQRVEDDMRALMEQLHAQLDPVAQHTCGAVTRASISAPGHSVMECARCHTEAMHAAAVTATLQEIQTAIGQWTAGGKGGLRVRTAGVSSPRAGGGSDVGSPLLPPELRLDGSPRSPRSPGLPPAGGSAAGGSPATSRGPFATFPAREEHKEQ